MDRPWTILGLDPAAATERDIKLAYAKLLKSCRPDQDPEGFRKLHGAYQAALRELEWRSDDSDDEEDDGDAEDFHGMARVDIARVATSEGQFPREESQLPEDSASVDFSRTAASTFEPSPGLLAISDCIDRLESSLADGDDHVAGRVKEAEALLYEHPAEVVRWGRFMQGVFARHEDHPELVLADDTIAFELEHGGASATLAVIERLDRKGDSQGIANLANLLLQNKERIATRAAALATVRLACAAAFWARGRKDPLADFAYQHLGRDERVHQMRSIDYHVEMASMLALVPVPQKSFWRQRLTHPEGRNFWTWDDRESEAAIEWLKTPMARRGPAFDVLVGLLPEELAVSVKAATEKFQGPEWEGVELGQNERKRQHRASPGTRIGTGLTGWQWTLILFFAVRGLLTCVNSSSRSSSPPTNPGAFSPAKIQQLNPEFQRSLKEGAEEFRELQEQRDRASGLTPERPSPMPRVEKAPRPDQPEKP